MNKKYVTVFFKYTDFLGKVQKPRQVDALPIIMLLITV